MTIRNFEDYKNRKTQLALSKGIMRTAKFNKMEDFVEFSNYSLSLEIDCVLFERQYSDKMVEVFSVV